jgi:prefoldin beta subunit
MSEDANAINKYKQQLMFLSNQKQQLQVQFNVLENTLKELENSKEKRVYKGVGNVFIMSDKDKVFEETKETKDTIDLKLKNIQKQEDTVISKINSLSKNETNKDDSSNNEGIA